jgi:hypothetical protein
MRKFLLASVALFGVAGSILTSNAIAASNDQRVASSEVQIRRMQERQSLMLDAHLARMTEGLKLTDEHFRVSDTRCGRGALGSLASGAKAHSGWRSSLDRRTYDHHVRSSSENGGATQ